MPIYTPSSTLTRPANTTAYAINDLVADNTTAGSITVPSIQAVRRDGGFAFFRRFRVTSNLTTGMGDVSLKIRFWSDAPTYDNGDNGAYSVATGAANYMGVGTVVMEQFSDGASGVGVPTNGAEIAYYLPAALIIYWDVQTLTAFTPISGQTITITPEIYA